MNEETKLQKFYDPEKMRNCLFRMEQFFAMSNDERVDEKHRKAAKSLYAHYKRLAMCILAKEFDEDMHVDMVLTPGFIDVMFSGPNPYLV